MKEINFFFNPPLFYFHGICGKVCLTDSDFFFASLVSLDVDVTGNITTNICEVWNEFSIFCKLVTMGTAPILNLCFDKIQNVRRCHGKQGEKIVNFFPNFKKLYSNVSCHMQICKQRY
jgi:phage-related protein